MSEEKSATPCPHIADCPLYAQFVLAANLALWKDRYCLTSYSSCERFKLSACGSPVPMLLLPSGALLRRSAK